MQDKNGFLKRKMNFQPPSNKDMKKMYEECGNSSGNNSSKKPPLPSFRNSSLVDETHVLPIDNQNKSNEAEATTTKYKSGPSSLMTAQELIELGQKNERNIDPATIDKKLKRTIANRESAQRYREKQAQKTEELETKVREMEETITATNVQLESVRRTRDRSRTLNIMMKNRLDQLSQKIILTNRVLERNKAEAKWLNDYLKTVTQNEQQNPGGMGGHEGNSNQFLNMEDIIDFHQGTDPST